MTHEQIRALMRGIAPVVSDYVRDEIHKANAKLTEEIAQLRAELSELRAQIAFDERLKALEANAEQPRSGVRRVA